jgi:carboxyl-terminal processing protease
MLNMTGQLLVIGEAGTSKINGAALLDADVAEKIDEIYSYMNIYYYGEFEKEDIYNSLYSGLLESLEDPYSVYYTPEEYEDMQVSTSGTYVGIGAGVSQDLTTMEVTITKVYRGTPAEEAGLKNGDKIVSVEDIEATSVESSELVQHIRGEEGTTVHMVIYRPSTNETLEFDVERRYVELPSIEGELLEDGIGYIQITDFQKQTDEQFAEMVDQLTAQGAKGLIIDVRANPGGLLTTVVNLLDQVLPEGMLVYVEDKYGNRDEYNSDAACLDLPIVVLMDESSASASEIFAGAMKDYQYATLVGKTTYGKGIVQNIITLSDGDAMKITTAKYFTPNGNDIHKVGVTPDVEVEYEYSGPEDETYDKQYDSQFLKAVEIMKEKLANE